ncbi:hypothetical protein IVA98_05710 [Bradyrhizobium sp. 160]|uniref:hypothetical protein n=1 Tax=Bradyrhizobium sp. 160 TaxID=2782634 RepID=UPI001FFC2678|nr:hypothetical protein [Bradyrhizobium sp. 160]MCK1622749.1 hypothetical protein [Bradyrhizobium sp. 160]
MITYDELFKNTPADRAHAINYSALYLLWKQMHDDSDLPRSEKHFEEWDAAVQHNLTPAEREFFLSPYGNLDLQVLDFRAVSRMNHLTKILVYRQGIRTTNGFNG